MLVFVVVVVVSAAATTTAAATAAKDRAGNIRSRIREGEDRAVGRGVKMYEGDWFD